MSINGKSDNLMHLFVCLFFSVFFPFVVFLGGGVEALCPSHIFQSCRDVFLGVLLKDTTPLP